MPKIKEQILDKLKFSEEQIELAGYIIEENLGLGSITIQDKSNFEMIDVNLSEGYLNDQFMYKLKAKITSNLFDDIIKNIIKSFEGFPQNENKIKFVKKHLEQIKTRGWIEGDKFQEFEQEIISILNDINVNYREKFNLAIKKYVNNLSFVPDKLASLTSVDELKEESKRLALLNWADVEFRKNPSLSKLIYGIMNLPFSIHKDNNGNLIATGRRHEILGSGVFGQVRKAFNLTTGKEIVTKKEKFTQFSKIPQIEKERKILKKLDFLIGTKDVPEKKFYSFQKRGGPTLKKWLEIPHSDEEKILMLIKVVDAVKQLHECGVLHNDLHAGNILVTKDEDVQLCDFGWSAFLNQDDVKKMKEERPPNHPYPPERYNRTPEIQTCKAEPSIDVHAIGMMITGPYYQSYEGEFNKGFDLDSLSDLRERCSKVNPSERIKLSELRQILEEKLVMRTENAKQKKKPLLGNGIMRMYNQFPYCYSSIGEMTAQLPSIKEMGFNVVWVNPLQETGKINVVREFNTDFKPAITNGSIYAMRDHRHLNSKFGTHTDNEKALKLYTNSAIKLGMVPIFDLVLNHVAKDSTLVLGTDTELNEKGIDTKKWFIIDPLWDDASKINYADDVVKKEVIEHIWKPYIEKYIRDYGFQGARIDAARLIPVDVQQELYKYIKEMCNKYHNGADPIIFTEILYSGKKSYSDMISDYLGIGITHSTNNAYWAKQDDYGMNNWKALNDKEGEYDNKKGIAQQLIHLNKDKSVNNRKVGGTVGFPGSHDEETLLMTVLEHEGNHKIPYISYEKWHRRKSEFLKETEKIKENYPNIQVTPEDKIDDRINAYSLHEKAIKYQKIADPKVIERGMRQRIVTAALTSDGGYYLMSGDEYGDPSKKNVFDIHDRKNYSWNMHWEGKYNLEGFVKEINFVLANLPKNQFPQWTEVITLPNHPDLFVAIRHNGHGFQGDTNIVLVNLRSDKKLNLTQKDMEQIIIKSASNAGEGYQLAYDAAKKATYHRVGNILIPPNILRKAEKGKESENPLSVSKRQQSLIFKEITNIEVTNIPSGQNTETNPTSSKRKDSKPVENQNVKSRNVDKF